MHDLVPIIMFTGLFAMIFGIYYVRSRENLAMLEKGFNPRENASKLSLQPFVSLKFGLLLTGAGLGLFAAYLIDAFLLAGRSAIDTTPLYASLIGLGGGIGLIICYFIEKKFWKGHQMN